MYPLHRKEDALNLNGRCSGTDVHNGYVNATQEMVKWYFLDCSLRHTGIAFFKEISLALVLHLANLVHVLEPRRYN